MTNQEVIKKINELINPYTGHLVEFKNFLVDIKIAENKIELNYKPLGQDPEINKSFNRSLTKLLKVDLKFSSAKISHPSLETSNKLTISDDTQVVAIMSGKGGVGKSQTTVSLANALLRKGHKVGIIDADIYGFSIPKILNLYGTPYVVGDQIVPLKTKSGIEVMSAQYFLEDNSNDAIVWRVSMVNKLMAHFFYDVNWSQDLDYILIDLPPGTGDVILNLNSYVKEVQAIIVTTANEDAAHVALRSGLLAQELKFDVLGVIENMSYYEHNGEKLYIFGKNGASDVSSRLDIPILAHLPIVSDKTLLDKYFDEMLREMTDNE